MENNENAKSNRKEVQCVVKGNVGVKKKSPAKRMLDNFISDDMETIKDHLMNDIIVPAIKDTIVDTIDNFTSMLFYGSDAGGRRRHSRGGRYDDRTNYNVISSNKSREDRDYIPRKKKMLDLEDIEFELKDDAYEVYYELCDIIKEYGMASVMQYKRLAGKKTNWTEDSYGWYDISNAKPYFNKGVWVINLPKPKEID